MTPEQILEMLPTVLMCLFIPCIILLIIRFIRHELRLHRNSQAPIYTERATVHYKHPDQEMVYSTRGDHQLFYITFHTDFGQQVKLYMTYVNFYTIEEGDTGLLTWQGEKFWKFVPDKKEG